MTMCSRRRFRLTGHMVLALSALCSGCDRSSPAPASVEATPLRAQTLADAVASAQPGDTIVLPTGTYEGEGYVILRHRETERVEEALKRLISLIRVELG